MSFIYLPSIKVQPYTVCGVVIFAVESVGMDYDTGDVKNIQLGWFWGAHLASDFLERVTSGDD